MTERTTSAGPSTFSEVRLSSATITPALSELIFKRQQSESVQLDDGNEYPTLMDLHRRSHSLHSDYSQALSTGYNSSSSESRCRPHFTRDDSYLSSIPTSPEDELSGSIASLAKATRFDNITSWSTPVNAPKKDEGGDNKVEQILGPSADVIEVSPIPIVSRGRQNAIISSHSRLAMNRNKPLPVPKELSIVPSSSPTLIPSYAKQGPRSPLPTLSISPAMKQQTHKLSKNAAPHSQAGSVEGDSNECLNLMMLRSSNTSRATQSSKASSPAKSSGKLSVSHSPSVDSTSSSTSQGSSRLPSLQTSQEQSLQETSPKVNYTIGPSSSSKPASPFIFRRGNSWLGGSKFDYLQERHLKAPPASGKTDMPQPSSSASSSSSRGSSEPEAKKIKRSSTSMLPTSACTDRGKRTPFTKANGTLGVDHTMSKSIPARPPLNRHRSKSMDVLHFFQSDNEAKSLKDLAGMRDSDSVALHSGVNDVYNGSIDRSRFSRLLNRRPSKAALKSNVLLNQSKVVPPKVPDKDDSLFLRHEGSREGALSRLTGSLLGKKSSCNVKTINRAVTTKQETSHQRKYPIDSQAVHVITQPVVMASGRIEAKKAAATKIDSNQLSRTSFSDSKSQRKTAEGNDTNTTSTVFSSKRSISISKLTDSHFRPSASDSRSLNHNASKSSTTLHSRNYSSDMDDDFFSIASMTPSTSDRVLNHFKDNYKVVNEPNSKETSPVRLKRISLSRRSTPPSAYRESGSEIKSTMTKSDSDSFLLNILATGLQANGQINSLQPPTARTLRRTSLSSISDGKSNAEPFIKPVPRAITLPFKGDPLLSNQDMAVSDTEDDPLPAHAHSSLKSRNESDNPLERKKGLHKPSLSIDVKATEFDSSIRSKSVTTFTKDSAQKNKEIRTSQRRPSQATLSIADDLEFLQALEHVRKVNQERIKKQDEEANRIEQMARLGMASVNRLSKGRPQARGRQDIESPRLPQGRRSSSAHERINSSKINQMPFVESDPVETPSALELGVGKASGKMQDGAFINDDDWKKEVKALFIIREIVLTERSYARHLEALLQSVLALYPKKHSSSTLSRSNGVLPGHITMMRRLLPQLIALSHGLADRIDANPTAAGVGTAFRLVNGQMEATFIAWSSVATDIMDALRISEKAKSKTKDRIGLITLSPLEGFDNVNDFNKKDGFKTVPSSPILPMVSLLAVQNSKAKPLTSSPTALTFEENETSTPLSFRRRSTLSGLPPSLTASFRNKAMSTISSDSSRNRKADEINTPTTPSSSFGKRAMEVMSSSNKPSHPKPRSDSLSQLLPSLINTTTTPTIEPFTGKRLSAMDVAIMPTQRVLRYLLLLRDLNMNTPPQSLSHIRLQRCIDSLAKVASSCDKASK